MIPAEKRQLIASPWTCLCFLKQLCLFIVYILLVTTVGVRWKVGTLAHEEVPIPKTSSPHMLKTVMV